MHTRIASCRRTRSDVLDTGNLRCGDTHHGGGDVRIPPPWDIAPGCLYRNQALPCNKPGREFGLELRHAFKLRFCKLLDSFIGKLDIVPGPLRQTLTGGFDFVGRDDDVAGPLVEFLSILAHFLFTESFYFGKHILDDPACIVFAAGG